MSLGFTDEDLAKTSLEYVQYPELRAVAVQGLALTQITVDDILAQDVANKPYTDFYRDIANIYSNERNFLDLPSLTSLPSEASLDAGARRDEKYYPVLPPNTWVNLPPKIQAENNGTPTIAYNGTTEFGSITSIRTQIDGIKNGISGSGSSQVETAYNVGDPLIRVDDVTSFTVNDFIFAINSGDALFARIDSIVQDAGTCVGGSGTDPISCAGSGGVWNQPLTGDLVITVLQAPLATIPIGTNVNSSIAGFSNAEREESVGLTPERQAQLNIFKDLVDGSIQSYEDFLSGQYIPLLNSNPDLKNKSDIENNISDINATIAVIDNWQSAPSTNPSGTGTESRFGDIEFATLETELDDRETYLNQRVTEVATALGSATQDGSGAFGGSGVFFDFADWENKRINTASGSLAKYYGSLIALEVSQQAIDNLDSNHAEQDVYFVIQVLTFNGDGTNTIFVGDTTGYEIADSIKVFAEGQSVIDATISSKTATSLTLSQNVSTDYSVSNIARILKQN